MATPTPKSTPPSTRFEPPSPKAKVSPGHDNRNQGQPPCNRARKRLLQDAHGVLPRELATHWTNGADAGVRDGESATEDDRTQPEEDFFGRQATSRASTVP